MCDSRLPGPSVSPRETPASFTRRLHGNQWECISRTRRIIGRRDSPTGIVIRSRSIINRMNHHPRPSSPARPVRLSFSLYRPTVSEKGTTADLPFQEEAPTS